jgi:hypothetical protein
MDQQAQDDEMQPRTAGSAAIENVSQRGHEAIRFGTDCPVPESLHETNDEAHNPNASNNMTSESISQQEDEGSSFTGSRDLQCSGSLPRCLKRPFPGGNERDERSAQTADRSAKIKMLIDTLRGLLSNGGVSVHSQSKRRVLDSTIGYIRCLQQAEW